MRYVLAAAVGVVGLNVVAVLFLLNAAYVREQVEKRFREEWERYNGFE